MLTFPVLLIFFASSIKRCGTIHKLSDCAISTLVRWQHWAAIRTWADMSFLSVGCTNRGGKNDGAVMVATLWIDILLKLCKSTTSLKKFSNSRMVLRFSWGNKRHNIEIARTWSGAGRAGNFTTWFFLIPMWLTKHEILSTHHEFDKKDVQGRRRVVVEVIREANASSMHSGHEHLLASIKAQLSPVLSKSFVQFHGKGSPSVIIIKEKFND